MKLLDCLNHMPVGDSKWNEFNGLIRLARKAGMERPETSIKPALVQSMLDYYQVPGRVEGLFSRLPQHEKDAVSLEIWSGGNAKWDDYRKISDKLVYISRHYFYGISDVLRFVPDDSAVWLLYPDGQMPDEFRELIYEMIGPMKRDTAEYPVSKDGKLICREDRLGDFTALVRMCGTSKFTVSKRYGLLQKKDALAFLQRAGYDELHADFKKTPEEAASLKDLLYTYALVQLSLSAGLIIDENGILKTGSRAAELLSLPQETMAARILSAFLEDSRYSEVEYISTGMRAAKRGLRLWEARQFLAQELKSWNTGHLVSALKFEKHVGLTNPAFARSRDTLVKYANSSYSPEWNSFESRLIQLTLLFFGVLGMLDLFWEGETKFTGQYGEAPSRVAAFRVTALGAWLLGLEPDYAPSQKAAAKEEGGFIVQPDYSVIVDESPSRERHEAFFSRCLTKVSEGGASIYRLDFEGLIRALDAGTDVAEIRDYLVSHATRPVPDNVLHSLDDWEKQSGRIKLSKVTVVECEDPELLEEILHYRGAGALVGGKICAAVVNSEESALKLKKLIEKNKRFCLDRRL